MTVMANTYPVMEVFPTLQGEGKFTGHPAYFIRLAGCDVGCSWCDVKESWLVDEFPVLSAYEIAEGAAESGHKLAVITGGEPCMYDLTSLTTALKNRGFQVHLETSGSHPIRGDFDWITLSPKKFKACLEDSYGRANELKVVVVNRHDLVWAKEQAQNVPANTLLYLQPEWSKKERVHQMMVDHLQSLDGEGWLLSEQTHKYLGIR
ncbi:MAG: 7-carboxy-7-deazaguanine synthase QueE [Crocinitomicaceae bacterium]|nr:7-carboxy-7-deazaguanine synthase QueE [Crocinitomicaceae bacterium]|tara:strand:+ start:1238 stop:1855 length:618 start_codon:yes stop_codon:yes gene_type:complete